MASLLSLKRRIQAAQNVSKTTRALQMISASKMKRAQEAALAARPYVEKLSEMTSELIAQVEPGFKHEYLQSNSKTDKTLIILLSPDKGLCGGMVTNLLREFYATQKTEIEAEYIVIGRKLEGYVARSSKSVIANFLFGTTTPTFDMVYPIVRLINEYYVSGKVKNVKVMYTHFDSIFSQKPRLITLLPFSTQNLVSQAAEGDKTDSVEYLYEPEVNKLLPSLLKHTLEMKFFQYLLESFVSEQGSRMVAMQNATDNANDIISEFKLEYNKTRQAKITSEILDIGSGQAVLN